MTKAPGRVYLARGLVSVSVSPDREEVATMNGFLLVYRCLHDDLPMYFAPGRKESWDYLLGEATVEEVSRVAAGLHHDYSRGVRWWLLGFKDGVPVSFERMPDEDFLGEDDEDDEE